MSDWIYFDRPDDLAFHTPDQGRAKDAVGKVAQLIPGPVLGAYGAALGTLPLFSPIQQPWVGGGLFLLGIAGTAWLIAWQMGRRLKKVRHIVVYAVAFGVWAYSLTGKGALPWLYHPGVAALLPILASFVFYQIRLPKIHVR